MNSHDPGMGGQLPPPALPPPPPPPSAPTLAPNRRTNGLAIASLCCSVGSYITGVTWILGIIFGHIALAQIRRDPTQNGKGIAIAGIAIGYFTLAMLVLGVVLLVTVA
jgi:hypothetical protein